MLTFNKILKGQAVVPYLCSLCFFLSIKYVCHVLEKENLSFKLLLDLFRLEKKNLTNLPYCLH